MKPLSRDATDAVDPIHVNDICRCPAALTLCRVLACCGPAKAPDKGTPRPMRAVIWNVVRRIPETGVTP